MNASTVTMRKDSLRTGLTIAFVVCALAVLGSRAQADEPQQEITISATKVKTTPYDPATHGPIQKVTVTAHVATTLDVLTLNSGVAILKDNVLDAARKVCTMADPMADDDGGDCVRQAVKDAQPQVDALISRARSVNKG
ncbi:MAG: UrcA family protein [Gammaproteobacteria bacterium]